MALHFGPDLGPLFGDDSQQPPPRHDAKALAKACAAAGVATLLVLTLTAAACPSPSPVTPDYGAVECKPPQPYIDRGGGE